MYDEKNIQRHVELAHEFGGLAVVMLEESQDFGRLCDYLRLVEAHALIARRRLEECLCEEWNKPLEATGRPVDVPVA